jgi:flavorubredoxin
MSGQATTEKGGGPSRQAVVIFNSRYGNTEKIARSLEKGLQAAGLKTYCVDSRSVNLRALNQYDLVCVGAPTEFGTAPRGIKGFLGQLSQVRLQGKYGFAFDTKLPSRFSGSAAKFIEGKLKKLGLEIVVPRSSAIVVKEKDVPGNAKLDDGEEERFRRVGVIVGTALVAKGKAITR